MKNVIITGGASGLGLALAHEYAAQDYQICIADMQKELGLQVVEELKARGCNAFFFELDVRSDEGWAELYKEVTKQWQQVDVLINNAGVAAAGLIEDLPMDDWAWLMDINVMGVVRGCKTFAPLMKHQGFGHIINVASMAGLLHAATMSAYNVSKSGVIALSETLRIELAGFNINVSVVCPAFFQTNLTATMRTNIPGVTNTVNKWMASSNVTADDVAKMTYDGMVHKRFFILTHRKEKMLWWLKRLSPEALQQLMIRTTKKQIQRMMEKMAS
ncbi:SDR family oxidoreductase [Litoribacillus peritrichatus]|uniref:SDR family oxidoreductase n=1 Tax=Litoribacillus peritrichatus TaxID=718191 RepID=A0ABP7MFU7_9GAMM